MKLREVFRYEIEHRVRSPSTWVYAAILFGLALLFNFAASPGDAAVHSNAPALLAFVMLAVSMFGLAISAALFGDAAVRDVRAESDPLLFTSPLRKAEYLGGRRREERHTMVEAESGRLGPVAVPRVAGYFGLRTTARQTLTVARRSLADVVASRWFIVVLLACTGLTVLYGWNVGDTVFDTSTWPVTLLVVETVLSERIVPVVYLLVALYAGELVWKEREVGEAEIAAAAPVPEGVALLGRFLALVALLAMFQAASMVGGILIQALQGYYHFEIGLYLRVVFGLNLADYVLLAALAMTIHVVVNHKYLGHMIALMAILWTKVAGRFGIRHHLLVYGTDPGWTYSDMNGFGPFLGPFVAFKLYWAAWALLLAVVAVLFWVRGCEPGLRRRLRLARVRFTGPVARTAGVAMALILVLGSFIFYNTNIVNEYRTADERGAPQAEYEKRYGRYEDVPQPVITGAELRVEIYPDEAAVDLHGSYRLVNRTGTAIDSIHVFFADLDIQARSISFDPAAEPVHVDDEAQYRIYALERALEPGDSLQLAFDVALRRRGFPNSGVPTDVVGNGAYFNRTWLPFIGYQPAFELSDDEARQRFGLEPRPPKPGPDTDVQLRRSTPGVTATWSAAVPMIASTWTRSESRTACRLAENGRRYFHYGS